MSEVALFLEKMHKTFKNKAQRCSTPLKMLYLQYNNIMDLPSTLFEGLETLVYLFLDANNITVIKQGLFEALPYLKVLNISFNFISKIEHNGFSNLKGLKQLYLQFNQLGHFKSDLVEPLMNLKYFNASQNKIQSVEVSESNLNMDGKVFDFRGNPLKSLSRSVFTGFKQSTLIVTDFSSCCFMDKNVTCSSIHPRGVYLRGDNCMLLAHRP